MRPTSTPPEPGRVPDEAARLMLRVRDGDRDAFRALYDRFASRAFAFAYRYTRERAAAEDLVQEAFLRVYRARASYVPTAKFATWFYRILTNLCLSRRKSREVPLDVIGDSDASMAPALEDQRDPDPAEALQTRELRERVRQAIAALPPRQRTAVLLRRFDDLSQAEVGEVMRMSEKAVKSLLARARESLRRTMEDLI